MSEGQTPMAVAVVASYRPDAELSIQTRALKAQFAAVVIVDDGSPQDCAGVLAQSEMAGAHVVRLPTNRGIAAALNEGVTEALRLYNPDYIATFDQDSMPEQGFLNAAIACHVAASAEGIAVGFMVAHSHGGRMSRVRSHRGRFDEALDPLQSGFVIPVQTWRRVGAFEEPLVIDGVDSEYTQRVRSHGLAVLIAAGARLEHKLGRRDQVLVAGHHLRLAGKPVAYNYHSPLRVYYIARNGTVLTLRYLASDPKWVFLRLGEEAKAHAMRLAFSPGRPQLLLAMLAGVVDGVRGRLGRIPDSLARRLASAG